MHRSIISWSIAAAMLAGCSGGGDPTVTAGASGKVAMGAPALTVSGGFSTATGSAEAAITVATLADLQAAFSARRRHIIVSGAIYGGANLTTLTFSTTDWNNTTIEGAAGGGAILENIQLKFDGELLPTGQNLQNIIVRNITFRGRIADLQAMPTQVNGTANKAGVNYLGVSLRRVTNAWVDHCRFYDTSDDLISVALASDNVTLSYNHFYFTDAWMNMNPDPLWNWVGTYQDLANERLTMVIGANRSDSYTYGGNALHVTMHHNRLGPNIKGRPLVRGWLHAYDNYFDNSTAPSGNTAAGVAETQYNALQMGSGSVIYSESNYFYKTNQSNQVGLDTAGDAYSFYETGNLYNAVTGAKATGTAYTAGAAPVSYAYTLDPVANVPNLVQSAAGPH